MNGFSCYLRRARWAWVLAIIGGLVWWLATLGQVPSIWSFSNYCALVILCLGVSAAITRARPRWFKWVAPALAVLALLIFGWFDTYKRVWATMQDPSTFEWVEIEDPTPWGDRGRDVMMRRYVDTYHRWSKQFVYRRMTTWFDESPSSWILESVICKGPMSPGGKPHGYWVVTMLKPPYQEREWYWYGEKVSEGEWNTRNR